MENLCNSVTTALPEIQTILIKILEGYISASLCVLHQSISFTHGFQRFVLAKYKSLRAFSFIMIKSLNQGVALCKNPYC